MEEMQEMKRFLSESQSAEGGTVFAADILPDIARGADGRRYCNNRDYLGGGGRVYLRTINVVYFRLRIGKTTKIIKNEAGMSC